LAHIAQALNVPVSFFFGGQDAQSEAGENINAGLSFLETAGALRVARAYTQIGDPHIRRVLVALAEEIAGSRRRPESAGLGRGASPERQPRGRRAAR
jgi:hypothetical protein